MMINIRIQNFLLSTVLALLFAACNTTQPEPVKLNVDNCYRCKMTVSDLKFATELITDKGRVYKFDDLKCMLKYRQENNIGHARYFVSDYDHPETLIKAADAFYVKGDSVRTPMNGFIAHFAKKESADSFAKKFNAAILSWQDVIH